jgi:hypothetical protein
VIGWAGGDVLTSLSFSAHSGESGNPGLYAPAPDLALDPLLGAGMSGWSWIKNLVIQPQPKYRVPRDRDLIVRLRLPYVF